MNWIVNNFIVSVYLRFWALLGIYWFYNMYIFFIFFFIETCWPISRYQILLWCYFAKDIFWFFSILSSDIIVEIINIRIYTLFLSTIFNSQSVKLRLLILVKTFFFFYGKLTIIYWTMKVWKYFGFCNS